MKHLDSEEISAAWNSSIIYKTQKCNLLNCDRSVLQSDMKHDIGYVSNKYKAIGLNDYTANETLDVQSTRDKTEKKQTQLI